MSGKKDLNRLKNVFSLAVEKETLRGTPILEALLQIKEEFGIDEDEIKACISDHLKQKISVEACRLNLVKGSAKKSSIADFF